MCREGATGWVVLVEGKVGVELGKPCEGSEE